MEFLPIKPFLLSFVFSCKIKVTFPFISYPSLFSRKQRAKSTLVLKCCFQNAAICKPCSSYSKAPAGCVFYSSNITFFWSSSWLWLVQRSLCPRLSEWLNLDSDRGTVGTPRLGAVLSCRACCNGNTPGIFYQAFNWAVAITLLYQKGLTPCTAWQDRGCPNPGSLNCLPNQIWTNSALGKLCSVRIIKYLLEMGEGKVELDADFTRFSSSLKAENMRSEIPVIHEVFSGQYQSRVWEQGTQSMLLFRSLNVLSTHFFHLQKGGAFPNAWSLPEGFQGTTIL